MTVPSDSARREASAAIFGNRAAAAVIDAINTLASHRGSVTTRMVARESRLGDSVVRPVMLRLAAAGAITSIPRDAGSRAPLHYQVDSDELWRALTAVVGTLPA